MFQMLTGNQSGDDVRSVVAKLVANIRQPQMKLGMCQVLVGNFFLTKSSITRLT